MVTFSLHADLKLDGSLMKPTMDFLTKLSQDPTQPSLHIETINNSVDKRVRTGRVTDQFRAVLFELKDDEVHHFILVDVDSHDEGTEKARKFDPSRLRLEVNPVNGITSLIHDTTPQTEVSDSEIKARIAQRHAEEQFQREMKGVEKQETQEKDLPPRTHLEEHGYTPKMLFDELGITVSLGEKLFTLHSESELDLLLQGSPAWEHEAILGLVAGYTIEEVRESLDLQKVDPSEQEGKSEDARLIEGLKQPAAALEFAYVEGEDTESLRNVIEAGDFDRWRVFIHPEQRRMAERSFSGSARVFGGAGTGKTVVAVHRANQLVTGFGKSLNPAPRVLFTTFTKGLAQGLKSQMNALNPTYPEAGDPGQPGLWIDNIDAVVNKVVSLASPEEIAEATRRVLGASAKSAKPYQESQAAEAWESVLLGADSSLPAELANVLFLSQEYETVVLANGITTQAEYLKVARAGRGTPLNRGQRRKVWSILESVMQTQAMDGALLWPTMSAVGAAVLRIRYENGGGSLFDHVVVDEAQDFNAGHWHFIRACVAEGPNDIFLAEDSHQRIYGQPLTLSHFGISTRGRASQRLTLNYRTTKETLNYALRILDGDRQFIDAEGDVDSTFGYRSARSGPAPVLLRCETVQAEFDAAAHYIRFWLDTVDGARVGVMCRSRGQRTRIANALGDHGIDAVVTNNTELAAHNEVSVMTMHGAKGMEFTHVVLMGVGRDIVPQSYRFSGLSEEDAAATVQQERSLLYVASSRARDALVITTQGEPSELLPAD